LSKVLIRRHERHFPRADYRARPRVVVSADGVGVVSHADSRLLADLADRSSLTVQLSDALDGLRRPRARHDPGRVLTDLAVAVADGGECISDIAVLGDQSALFGPVASDSTVWRLLDQLDGTQLAAVAQARAAAREVVWAQRGEATGAAFPLARAAGRNLPGCPLQSNAAKVGVLTCGSQSRSDRWRSNLVRLTLRIRWI